MIQEYFNTIKAEYVHRVRPVAEEVLQEEEVNYQIKDPVGRTLDLFKKINTALKKDFLKYLWEDNGSGKIYIGQINEVLTFKIQNNLIEEGQRNTSILKDEQEFYRKTIKFMIETKNEHIYAKKRQREIKDGVRDGSVVVRCCHTRSRAQVRILKRLVVLLIPDSHLSEIRIMAVTTERKDGSG